MKKGRLLNAELSYVIARLGHTDTLTIADSGRNAAYRSGTDTGYARIYAGG